MIINAGGPVELTDLLAGTENICAILNISQLGQEGGNAVADILFGEFTPSGKLTTTWTKRYDDCPAAEEFSYLNGNLETEEYAEGIYVFYLNSYCHTFRSSIYTAKSNVKFCIRQTITK